MLVIIGLDWASLAHPNGEKRLFDPNDVTRWEVETGLRRSREEDITVIPVLVTGAQIPKVEELPQSLHPLLDKNVINLRNFPDFDSDVEKLVRDIRSSQGFKEDDITTADFEPKTIYVVESPFWMGSLAGEGIPDYETPQHEVSLLANRIGKYPVTNVEYEVFIHDTGRMVKPSMGWDGQRVPDGHENHPVAGLTWYEALAYCQWLTEKTGRRYTLPNEAQWEKSCRGGDRCLYPWGDEFDPKRSNHGCSTLAAVDAYPAQNEFGCFDFVGNVCQWTCSLWGEKRITHDSKYAYLWKDDRRNDLNANSQIHRVIRGSSMTDDLNLLRCSARGGQLPNDVGLFEARHSFRVVMIV